MQKKNLVYIMFCVCLCPVGYSSYICSVRHYSVCILFHKYAYKSPVFCETRKPIPVIGGLIILDPLKYVIIILTKVSVM